MIVGLVKQLAMLPVAPLRLTVWVGDKVAEQVERERFSPEARMRQLREIEQKRESGELSEEAAADAEAKIIEAQTTSLPSSNPQQKGQNDG